MEKFVMSRGIGRVFEQEIWYEFGVYFSGNVDIANINGDVLTNVEKTLAHKIIDEHNEALDRLEGVLVEYGETC